MKAFVVDKNGIAYPNEYEIEEWVNELEGYLEEYIVYKKYSQLTDGERYNKDGTLRMLPSPNEDISIKKVRVLTFEDINTRIKEYEEQCYLYHFNELKKLFSGNL